MRNTLGYLGALAAIPIVLPSLRAMISARREGIRPPRVIVIEGHRAAEEASVSTKALHYLPFDIPPGVTKITIHKELEHGPDATRKNTVDMGLFDPRGGSGSANQSLPPAAAGFRAWQGGVNGDLVVTGDAATSSPHAIPGPLPAGRWQIVQYYLASAPAGLGYKYTVTLSFDGPLPGKVEIPKYEPGILNSEAGWYAANLHSHTIHSDGGRTLDDLVTRNESAGFAILASTEHNSTTAQYHFADVSRAHPRTLLLFGDEFTTPGGHANIIGQQPGRWFDFRLDPGDGNLPAIIDEVHRQKAVFIVNHPFALCTTCTWRYPIAEWSAKADAIEVWNGDWTPEDRAAVNLWDSLLKQGRHITASGGTDYHRGDDALAPAALIYASHLSRDAIIDGIRRGHLQLSENPQGPRIFLTVEGAKKQPLPGDTLHLRDVSGGAAATTVTISARVVRGKGTSLRLVWADGEALLPVSGDSDETTLRQQIPLTGQGRYVRAELITGSDKLMALTNPIYLEP